MARQQKNKKTKKRLIIFGIFLSLIFILLMGCFYILSRGITIDKISVAGFKMQGLYLKLDNKLILSIDHLLIKQKKQQNIDLPQAINWFQKSLIAISYFEKIHIKKINLGHSQSASIFYDGKIYYLKFPEVQAFFQIRQNDQQIELAIKKLILRKFKTQINGRMIYSLAKSKINFSLVAYALKNPINTNEKIVIKGESNFKAIAIQAISSPITSLSPYQDEIKKIPALYDWLIQKSSFAQMEIKNLSFWAPLNQHFKSKMLKNLRGEIILKDASLKLTPQLAPITTPLLKAKFQKEVLSFELQNPHYEGINLDGSFVELHHLTNPNLSVKTLVHLKSKNAILDKRVHKILQTYHIDFDINQTQSVLDLDLKLEFQKLNGKLNVQAQGDFKSQNASLNLFGMPLFAPTLHVALEFNPSKRHILIHNSQAQLQNPMIAGLLNCSIDLDTKTIEGNLKPSLIQIQTTPNASSPFQQILTLKQKDLNNITFRANYANSPSITIPDFGIDFRLGKEKYIELDDISKLYPYSPLLQYLAIKYGTLSIKTKDFANFTIAAKLKNLKYPIFNQKFNPINTLNANIQITPKKITAKSLDGSIALHYENNLLKVLLKNKDFILEHLQKHQIPALSFDDLSPSPKKTKTKTKSSSTAQAKQTASAKSKKKSNFKLYLESKNSTLKYKDFIIPTDEIIINSKPNKTTLDATHKNGVLNLDFYDGIIRFSANNFSGNFVNLVAGKEVVQGGLFSAKGIYKNKILRSTLEIQNTIFKNFATLQNIVALIDTIPSLIVFKKPGFSTKGYQVSQGRISVEINDEYLGLKRIELIGDSIDITGGGVITLKNQELNISLTISTIKGLSEVLSKIPIVGYLLLGKEGKISTSLILTGTVQKPKSEVTLAQDILSAPFKIIERIFIPD